MSEKITLTLELSPRLLERLARLHIPEELAGPSIEEKITFLIDDACIAQEAREHEEKGFRLYRQFNMRHPRDRDDDLTF